MPTPPLSSGDDRALNSNVNLPSRGQALEAGARRQVLDRGLQNALGLHELALELVDLHDFTFVAISNAALRRVGLPAELVIGHHVTELLQEEDREASRIALEALRDGVIDFYRAHRRLHPSDTSGLAFTAWARTVEFTDARYALVEMVFTDQTDTDQISPSDTESEQVESGQVESGQVESGQVESGQVKPGQRRTNQKNQSPLAEILGHDPPVMALGTVDSAWVVTSISKDIVNILGLAPEFVIGTQLLGAVEREDVQRLLDADRLVSDEYSVSRSVRMRDANGQWRPLCCVLTSIAKPGDRSFILLPYDEMPEFDSATRTDELEHHLFRIAAEIEASGILQRVGDFPDPSRLPELAELSARQWEVLRRLMRGQRVPTIAAEMYLSQSTIRNHLSAIFERFGVHSQTELLALMTRR